ncbi:MAG: hypothetical protein HY280_06705 [Nitrospinae bacterium]|nr:hypothetical protein [Nitrospinota bacterium]
MYTNKKRRSFGLIIGSQAGLTVVEMVVAIAVASVLGMAMMKMFTANKYLYAGEKSAGRTFTNAMLVMEELTKSVRMANYNPMETPGGVFGVQQCDGTVGSLFFSTKPIAAGNNGALFFTRDFNENGILDPTSGDTVGFNWKSTTNTLQVASINPATGGISAWQDKYPNVTNFVVDYQYFDGTWASAAGMPDPTVSDHTFGQIAAVSISLTMRSEKPHQLTGQYIYETINSTLMLRSKYYY